MYCTFQTHLWSEGGLKVHKLAADGEVVLLQIHPGFRHEIIEYCIDQLKVKGIVLQLFGTGNGPDLESALNKAVKNEVVVVVCTECHKGIVEQKYAASLVRLTVFIDVLQRGKVAYLKDMTAEAAFAKLCVALAAPNFEYYQCIESMQTSWKGEVTINARAIDASIALYC